MNFLGFTITRKQEKPSADPAISFTAEDHEDGATVVAAGGSYGTYVDLDGTVRNENELIAKYRAMALQPECDIAIEDIVNEVIVNEDDSPVVDIDLSGLDEELPPQIIEIIREEFDHCKDLLEIEQHAYEIFRRWYVDGRINYHCLINPEAPEEGLVELRYIDSRKIKKIREIMPQRIPNTNVTVQQEVNEYYIYSEKGFGNTATTYQNAMTGEFKIAKDAVITVNSGIVDPDGKMVLSYLHKAIKPLNQLRMLEDATIIYHLARAPERRAFYIDTGNLPKMKADQYVRDLMVRYKNRLVYDADSGRIRDDRKYMTMTDDFWLPRREGGTGTQIDILQGGQNLNEMADFVEFFKQKMYQSMNVPYSRLQPESVFNLGRASEITRDELKFQKLISRLRHRFSELFYEILGKQLVLKQVMTIEEWEAIRKNVVFTFARDNYFSELKDMEIFRERMATIQAAWPYVGILFSREYLFKTILRMTDEEIEEMIEQIEAEGFMPSAMGPIHPDDPSLAAPE